MEPLIFVTAILNSILLTTVFLSYRAARNTLVKRLGIAYLTLAAPGTVALYLAIAGGTHAETIIFLGIFLAYLLIEWLYDFALKLDFRRNWKLLTPYLLLYFAMNYGFFVMTWRRSYVRGSIVLALTAIQITANMLAHVKKTGNKGA